MVRAPCCDKMGLKKGPWSSEEDQILVNYIRLHGHNNWRALPKHAGLLRCGKSCRLRWTNYLRPDIKRGNFSQDEEETIIKLHQLLGNRWSAIAGKLPGRTDNEIKNVWHTHLKKRLPPHLVNNPTNCGSTSTTPVSSPATAINVAAGPTRKRSRKTSISKGNVVPKKRASTHEKTMEPSVNHDVIAPIEIAMPTSSVKIEPVSPQPCTSDVSTLTSTSTNTDSNRGTSTNRENIVIKVENDPCQIVGVNQNDIGDMPDINDDFWMEVLSVEDTAISTEGLASMSQPEGNILGTDPVFETEYSNNVNYEDMDVFWHNLLTESHELPEIIEIL